MLCVYMYTEMYMYIYTLCKAYLRHHPIFLVGLGLGIPSLLKLTTGLLFNFWARVWAL